MKTMAVYNNKAFEINGSYNIKSSNREVQFSDIEIDFTGKGLADMPYKYQEIKIKQAEDVEHILQGNTIYTGFVDTIKLSKMQYEGEDRILTLTLLSPLAMATKRSVTLIGTNKLSTAINRILEPLLNDGFTIEEFNITDGQITTNFVLETVENCMNTISYKRGIFWYIDENKKIYVNNIDYLFGLNVKKQIISGITNMEREGIYNLQPSIENVNYANVLNFKNVRVYTDSNVNYDGNISHFPLTEITTLHEGDSIEFKYPIIIGEKTAKMLAEEKETNYIVLFRITILFSSYNNGNYVETERELSISYNNGNYVVSQGINFSDKNYGDNDLIILQKDDFFSNMITRFSYNGTQDASIKEIRSESALRYTMMRFMFSQEIEKMKGIISDSGQIERTIDYNEQWITEKQLINYARSLIVKNSNVINSISIYFDKNPNLRIGDIIKIKFPEFYINENKFAVTDIKYNYINDENQSWEITVKNSDFVSTYIDLFRPQETQQEEENINTIILSEFIEETINETHNVEVED